MLVLTGLLTLCTTLVLSAQPRPAHSYLEERPQPQPLVLPEGVPQKGVKRDVKLLLPPQAFAFNPNVTYLVKKKRENPEIRKLDSKRILIPKKFARSTNKDDYKLDEQKTVEAKTALYRDNPIENKASEKFIKHEIAGDAKLDKNTAPTTEPFFNNDNIQYFEISNTNDKQEAVVNPNKQSYVYEATSFKPISEATSVKPNEGIVIPKPTNKAVTPRGTKKFEPFVLNPDPVSYVNKPRVTNRYEEFPLKPNSQNYFSATTPYSAVVLTQTNKYESVPTPKIEPKKKDVFLIKLEDDSSSEQTKKAGSEYEINSNSESDNGKNYYEDKIEIKEVEDNYNEKKLKSHFNDNKPENLDGKQSTDYDDEIKIVDYKPKNFNNKEIQQPEKLNYFEDTIKIKPKKPEDKILNNKEPIQFRYFEDKQESRLPITQDYFEELKEAKEPNYFKEESEVKEPNYFDEISEIKKHPKNLNYKEEKPKSVNYYKEETPKSLNYYEEEKPKSFNYYVEEKPKSLNYYNEEKPNGLSNHKEEKPKSVNYYEEIGENKEHPKGMDYYEEVSTKTKQPKKNYYKEEKPKSLNYYKEEKPKGLSNHKEEKPKSVNYYEEIGENKENPKGLDYYEEVSTKTKQPKKTSYFEDNVSKKHVKNVNYYDNEPKNYYKESKKPKKTKYYEETSVNKKHPNYYDDSKVKQSKEIYNYEDTKSKKNFQRKQRKPINSLDDKRTNFYDYEQNIAKPVKYFGLPKQSNSESRKKETKNFRIYEDYDDEPKDLENQPIIVREVAAEPEEYGDEAETKNYGGHKEEIKKDEALTDGKDYEVDEKENVKDYDYEEKPKKENYENEREHEEVKKGDYELYDEEPEERENYEVEEKTEKEEINKESNNLYPQPVKEDYKVHEGAEKKAVAGGGKGKGGGGHKKEEPKNVEHEKGGGKKHESEHKQVHKEGGEKKYQGKHVSNKHELGHHGKEDHKEHFKDDGGSQKKHHDSEGYHGEHDKADKGEKGAKYNEEGNHEKGHSTHGTHNIHKKDEFEKKEEFYDEYHEGGDFDKSGGFFDEEDFDKGGHYKKNHKEGAAHHDHYDKKDGHEHGDYFKDEKGHKSLIGHDVHHGHIDDHHAKLTKSGHKKWGYHNEHDDGGKKGR